MTSIILIIEENKDLQTYLKKLLSYNNFVVKITADEASTLEYLEKNDPDIVILDIDTLEKETENLYEKIKKKNNELPIILLAEKDETSKILKGFDAGADDYIAKPLSDDNELITRIRVRLRKQKRADSHLLIADLELNGSNMEVKRHGKLIQLTPQEFKLLQYLMSNQGKILTREMILSRIWEYSSDIKTRVVDVYMGYLRKKIDDGFGKKLLHSIRGYGYVIKE